MSKCILESVNAPRENKKTKWRNIVKKKGKEKKNLSKPWSILCSLVTKVAIIHPSIEKKTKFGDEKYMKFFLINYFIKKNPLYILLLPQANGYPCVDFQCTHSIWHVVLKSTHLLVGFIFKIWMLGNWFNHISMSFYFFGLSFAFLYHKLSYHYEM